MGIWLYIPHGIYPRDKKNYKKFLIILRSFSNNSLMSNINLQCGIKEAMLPKVEWPHNNFFMKHLREAVFYETVL